MQVSLILCLKKNQIIKEVTGKILYNLSTFSKVYSIRGYAIVAEIMIPLVTRLEQKILKPFD